MKVLPAKKICNACGLLKTFHRTRASYCKDCCKKHERDWRAKNQDKVKARTKEKAHDPENKLNTSTYRKVKRRTDAAYREKEMLYDWKSKLRRNFGMTVEDWRQMAAQQHDLCAICGKPETTKIAGRTKRLAVDHDHATNKVRALLCGFCNSGLGQFFDDAALLKNAITYLEHHAGKSSASA